MEENQLTHTDEVVLGILKRYTDDIQIKKDECGTVFELTFLKDSGNLKDSRRDPDTLVQHGIDREVAELLDPLCSSGDVDFVTYSVYYAKYNVLIVWYNTFEQREVIESMLENQKIER